MSRPDIRIDDLPITHPKMVFLSANQATRAEYRDAERTKHAINRFKITNQTIGWHTSHAASEIGPSGLCGAIPA